VCDLEGRPRREAARLLRIAEGTLSSRLTRARTLLAKRLMRCGVTLSATVLAGLLCCGAASARMPAVLVSSTARAAMLLAAGQVAVATTPAALLMKEVMKTMLLKKLRLLAGAVLVLTALGAVGLGYQAGGGAGAAQAAEPARPRNEVEALRRENDLLKLNLEVVLEKVRAQETQLRELRTQKTEQAPQVALRWLAEAQLRDWVTKGVDGSTNVRGPDALKEAENALKSLREAKDNDSRRNALDSLENAVQKLKLQPKKERN
jgi:hypothetical protein